VAPSFHNSQKLAIAPLTLQRCAVQQNISLNERHLVCSHLPESSSSFGILAEKESNNIGESQVPDSEKTTQSYKFGMMTTNQAVQHHQGELPRVRRATKRSLLKRYGTMS
jgi:hypothetical protein